MEHGFAVGVIIMSIAALKEPRIQDRVEHLLAGHYFDHATAHNLANRSTYADAATYLLVVLTGQRSSRLIAAILDPAGPATPYRLALAFGALSDSRTACSLDSLRISRHPRARLALIAMGDSIDWRTAGRDERAVFSLRHIVRTMAARHD